MSTLVFWRKQLRVDSGGPGTTRGGLGQDIQIGNSNPEAFSINTAFERVEFPALGYAGGSPGASGYVGLTNGQILPGKGRHLVPKGERIIIQSPGGGGLGDPAARDPALITNDVANGLVSARAAEEQYRGPAL